MKKIKNKVLQNFGYIHNYTHVAYLYIFMKSV